MISVSGLTLCNKVFDLMPIGWLSDRFMYLFEEAQSCHRRGQHGYAVNGNAPIETAYDVSDLRIGN